MKHRQSLTSVCKQHAVLHYEMSPQSRQSARLSLQSSELAPPPPHPQRRGDTLALERGTRGDNSKEKKKLARTLQALIGKQSAKIFLMTFICCSPSGLFYAFCVTPPSVSQSCREHSFLLFLSISLFSLMLINLKYVLVCKKFYCCLALQKPKENSLLIKETDIHKKHKKLRLFCWSTDLLSFTS